jgi:hypothetical protein
VKKFSHDVRHLAGDEMSDIQVSKHYKNGCHHGFRKYVYGRSFHLVNGVTPAHEQQAKTVAERLVAHAEELRRVNGEWTDAAIEEAFNVPLPVVDDVTPPLLPLLAPIAPARVAIPVMTRRVVPLPATTVEGSIWLYAAIEMYKDSERLRERCNDTSHENAKNNIFRIEWSKEGISDRPLHELRTVSVLKAWRGHFTARPISKRYGKPIAPSSASGVCQAIRHFLDWCDAEQLWKPCHRWRDAFKGISVKKLSTSVERNKNKRLGFFNFTLREMRLAWHFCLPDHRVLLGLGLWCGHTQNELATILRHGEFFQLDSQLYLERDRHKTGIYGKWWIPPELAALVIDRLKKTPMDMVKNPCQVAFLTRDHRKLVHHGLDGRGSRSDSVSQWWERTLKAATAYGVRYHSFKYLRKTMAQQVRNRLGVEYATMFSAEKIAGVQDENYTNANFEKIERCIREEIYPIWRGMFGPISLEELTAEFERAKTPAIKMSDGEAATVDGRSQMRAIAV